MKDNGWIVGAVILVALFAGAAVFGVLNFIWWRECVDAGGAYINGNGMWPSCFRG